LESLFYEFWDSKIKAIERLVQPWGVHQIYHQDNFTVIKIYYATLLFQIFLISWFEYGLTTIIGTGKVKL
jgi:putative spermidine/putrescine transport system permease protein